LRDGAEGEDGVFLVEGEVLELEILFLEVLAEVVLSITGLVSISKEAQVEAL
jgi:hypothetical protein